MPAISSISIVIKAITSPFIKGISAAIPIVGKFTSMITSLAATILKFSAVALTGLTAVLAAFLFKVIKVTSGLEDLETQFQTLLGSATAAKKRMQELKKFSAETPFQIEGVAKASKILETLTGGALATGDGLRLVGDAAAIAGRPIEELAVQMGRAFQGAMTGRAIGEALARLQELGILSGEARTEFERLQKANKKGSEVWQVLAKDMQKTQGSMKLLSTTASGLFSTLKDNLNLALAELGAILLPLVKVILKGAIEKFQDLKQMIIDNKDAIKTFILEGIEKLAPVFIQMWNVAKAIFNGILDFFSNSGPLSVDDMLTAVQDFFIKIEFGVKNLPEVFALTWEKIKNVIKQKMVDITATIIGAFRFIGIMIVESFKLAFKITIAAAKNAAKLIALKFQDAVNPFKDYSKEIAKAEQARNADASRIFKDFGKNTEALDESIKVIRNSMVSLFGDPIKEANKLQKKIDDLQTRFEEFKKQRIKGNKAAVKDLVLELEKAFKVDPFQGIIDNVTDVARGIAKMAGGMKEVAKQAKLVKIPQPELALAGSQAAARLTAGLVGKSPLLKVNEKQLVALKNIERKMAAGDIMNANFGFAGG